MLAISRMQELEFGGQQIGYDGIGAKPQATAKKNQGSRQIWKENLAFSCLFFLFHVLTFYYQTFYNYD